MLTFVWCLLQFSLTHHKVLPQPPLGFQLECVLTYNARDGEKKFKEKVASRGVFFLLQSICFNFGKAQSVCMIPHVCFTSNWKSSHVIFIKERRIKIKKPALWHVRFPLSLLLFIYFFGVACLCRSSKKLPPFPPTAQGETSLKLAPIYGVRSCQREIPLSLKKANWICVSSIILKPLALKQKQRGLLFGFLFTPCLHILLF